MRARRALFNQYDGRVTTATEPTTLDRLAEDYWNAWIERHPVHATALGDRRHDDRLDDDSPAARAAWRRRLDDFEGRLRDQEDDTDPVTRVALAEALIGDRAFLD